jgi:hypothetical protein
MKTEDLFKRIDSLILKGEDAIKKGGIVHADVGLWGGFRTASLSFIKSLYGEKHPYYDEFRKIVEFSYNDRVSAGINILISIKYEIENGYLHSLKNLISAEVFSDFMEMSKYLLDQNYKDASAVIIGSVLEEHIRSLCKSNSIEVSQTKGGKVIPIKADLLNSELVKSDVYGILEQKNVTAWLDLRNKAAHGKYSEYTFDHVSLMYQGVLNFISSTTEK